MISLTLFKCNMVRHPFKYYWKTVPSVYVSCVFEWAALTFMTINLSINDELSSACQYMELQLFIINPNKSSISDMLSKNK